MRPRVWFPWRDSGALGCRGGGGRRGIQAAVRVARTGAAPWLRILRQGRRVAPGARNGPRPAQREDARVSLGDGAPWRSQWRALARRRATSSVPRRRRPSSAARPMADDGNALGEAGATIGGAGSAHSARAHGAARRALSGPQRGADSSAGAGGARDG